MIQVLIRFNWAFDKDLVFHFELYTLHSALKPGL